MKNQDIISSVVGQIITEITLDDTSVKMLLADKSVLVIKDGEQQCCEKRYMSTDDDLPYFIGSELRGVEIRPAPNGPADDPVVLGGCDEHEIQFLVISTSKGALTLASHNEHNGYYGGFDIQIELLTKLEKREERMNPSEGHNHTATGPDSLPPTEVALHMTTSFKSEGHKHTATGAEALLVASADHDTLVDILPYDERGDGISIQLPFPMERQPGHANIVEAIRDTNDSMSQVRMEKRNRDKWLYIATEEPEAWAAGFFGRPTSSPTVVGVNAAGMRLVAVWNRNGLPDCLPDFV